MKKLISKIIQWAAPELFYKKWKAVFLEGSHIVRSYELDGEDPYPVRLVLPRATACLVKAGDFPEIAEMEVWYPINTDWERRTIVYATADIIKKLDRK